FLIATSLFLLASCDVRRKDAQQNTNKITKQLEIKDPTTVLVIDDTAYNFGKATDGEVVTYNYRFVNTGSKPLIISDAHASCGCTVPEKPEAPIQPGDTGFLKVSFNSAGRVGQVHKNVTVSSNAEPAFPELMLAGEVVAKNK
ncbi:MAG: DUF1573 domain-containing protein, partial [Ferruginibacter sp.]